MKACALLLWLLSLSAFGDPVTDYDERFRLQYRALHQKKVWSHPDGSLRFDRARLYRRHGIGVLFVQGDEYEMAYQHGRLLRQEILLGAVPQSAVLVENVIENRFGHSPFVSKTVKALVHRFVTRKLIDNGLAADPKLVLAQLGAIFGLSHATSLDAETVLTAAYAPEVLMVLADQQSRGGFGDRLPAALSSCTDFAAWDEGTADGNLIIGRNLDYPLTGYFDRYPTVIYFEPTSGGQPYLGVASAGVHNAGLTGYNASGIFLGAHTVPSSDTNTDGAPGFIIANEVLRYARTFDEAVALFRKSRPATGYGYTLVSVGEKRAATVELSGSHLRVRENPQAFLHAQSNHYRHPEMKAHYLTVNQSADEDSWARLERVHYVLNAKRGTFAAKDAMLLLADQYDPFKKQTVSHGYTVAVSTTVSSSVFVPAHHRLYVSRGTAPASHGTFVSLPLPPLSPDAFSLIPSIEIDNLEFAKQHGSKYQAVRSFIQAKQAYEYRNDPARAEALLSRAIELDPSNRNLRFMRAFLQLKQSGKTAAALSGFQSLSASPWDRPAMLSAYFEARIHADQGRGRRARHILDGMLLGAELDPLLEKAVRDLRGRLNWLPVVPFPTAPLTLLMQQADLPSY